MSECKYVSDTILKLLIVRYQFSMYIFMYFQIVQCINLHKLSGGQKVQQSKFTTKGQDLLAAHREEGSDSR